MTVLEAAVASCEKQLTPEGIEDDPNSSADDAARRELEEIAVLLEDAAELGDNGNSLVVDGSANGETLLSEQCLYRELSVSDALRSLMERTSSMMGPQDYEENGLNYRWTYHPDNGLDTVIVIAED